MPEQKKPQQEPTLTPVPCPWCGKKPKVMPSHPEHDGNAWGRVACVTKTCPVKPSCNDGSNVSDYRGSGAYKDLAISRWNQCAK